jgi:hypothetical protein
MCPVKSARPINALDDLPAASQDRGMAETTTQKIARLRELLESGVSSDSRDGASTTFDLESVRRELLRLEQAAGTRKRRPRVINLQMGRR